MEDFLFIFKHSWFILFIIILLSYLIGAVNFSILATKNIFKQEDIRTMGSGNAGFTNVLRSAGKGPAIVTFIGDFSKGVLAVWLGKVISMLDPFITKDSELVKYFMFLAGIACVIGHIYPCFFEFKGGKGILTGWSITLLIDLRVFFTVISVFLVVLFITKIVSLASIFAASSYPIATFMFYYMDFKRFNGSIYYVIICTTIAFLTAILVVLKHKSNILRLISGTEKKITCRK